MTTIVEYSIVPIKVEDTEEVIEFLRKFFFRDEPLSSFIKLLEGPDDRCLELEQYAAVSIPQGKITNYWFIGLHLLLKIYKWSV